MDDDELERRTEQVGAEFLAAQAAMAMFTAYVRDRTDAQTMEAAFENAKDAGIGVWDLFQGMMLVAYFGYDRAAKASGQSVEAVVQAQANEVAFTVEKYREHKRGDSG